MPKTHVVSFSESQTSPKPNFIENMPKIIIKKMFEIICSVKNRCFSQTHTKHMAYINCKTAQQDIKATLVRIWDDCCTSLMVYDLYRM